VPLLSIIVPTFNSAASIERSLESIAVQSFSDYEVIVQDGSPADDTARAIGNFLQLHPKFPLRLFRESDRGVYDAMNKATLRARGEWLYFLGSDDLIFDDRVLAVVMSPLNTATANVIYGNVEIVGDCAWARSGTIYDSRFDLPKLLNRNICHQAIFYKADFARSVGEYQGDYRVCGDWDFTMRCWARTQFKYIDVTVAKFAAGGLSSTNREDGTFDREFLDNVLRYFRLSPLSPLVNAPTFKRLSDVIALQQRRGRVYSLCGRALRFYMRRRTRPA
jgi:glycosyltransferase involved in cell wall biosynthesis